MRDDGAAALRFTYRSAGNAILIHRGDTLAATLKGAAATNFLSKAEGASEDVQQQIMARLTGNYKRGNERAASGHARNRTGRRFLALGPRQCP